MSSETGVANSYADCRWFCGSAMSILNEPCDMKAGWSILNSHAT